MEICSRGIGCTIVRGKTQRKNGVGRMSFRIKYEWVGTFYMIDIRFCCAVYKVDVAGGVGTSE